MTQLYPSLHAYNHFTLQVDDVHEIYIEECGNPDGVPIVFLHGGPGAGCESYHRRFFDPDQYRIILFDQRGCGRSTPHAELENNTTPLLISDMELIRQQLGIDKWAVFGGSWGSTLALAYAETHPEQVNGMIVRGIFFSSDEDIQWFYQHGASKIFPDYWRDFLAPIPRAEHDDLLRAYYQRLTGSDEIARIRAAKAWSKWEGQTATLLPSESVIKHFTDPHAALSIARIEAHYFVNKSFMDDGQLLDNAGTLAAIPGYIIHGRYDMICPLENALKLHQAWLSAELIIVEGAGHAASEEGIISALVDATDKLLEQL
ncbi:MAG: prolyl aminopeptidase [Thiotrichaceae bacterium]